ncbi:FAD-dependent oxidoreductase [Telmatospirillum sp. J64-1]|uniref:FAD-dependent oxidoreductase n=1 Tax=Telmatospirillum sp. J64-1 TaxID=2502183 RepID=UPI00115D3EB4|nr:FAD-dependent oxidoreductase [Telmatospirillum sp. J64-1]
MTIATEPSFDVSPVSWWMDEAMQAEGGEGEPLPPDACEGQEVDVAIIGGGFTGLWTALLLAQKAPTLSIAVIEAGLCGGGASGKNGGKAHGYWAQLPHLIASFGEDQALAIARAGSRAQEAIRAFAKTAPLDFWWRDGGNIRVATTPQQEAKLRAYVDAAARLGEPEQAVFLPAEEVRAYCDSPAFLSGVFFQEGATVQPARLARALRSAALAQGVRVFEHTAMTGRESGGPCRVRTTRGTLTARQVVLATNVALARESAIAPVLSVFSSYAAISTPTPALERMGWNSDVGFADARMFLHYFRRTLDDRVLMGAGAGPVAYGNRWTSARMTRDRSAAQRAVRGMMRLLPALGGTPVEKAWGGAIDVASDRLPFVGTLPGGNVHYACGYSGHGVTPTHMAAQCLVSLVLGLHNEWRDLPLMGRRQPRLPPEPFRFVGATSIRRAILACEDAEERGDSPSWLARAVATVPVKLGLKIGVR